MWKKLKAKISSLVSKIKNFIKKYWPFVVSAAMIAFFFIWRYFNSLNSTHIDSLIADQKKKIDQRKKDLDLLKKQKDQKDQVLKDKMAEIKKINDKIAKEKKERDKKAEKFFPDLKG